MIHRYAYKTIERNTKPFERLSDKELIELYYKVLNSQHKKKMNLLTALNKYMLKTGKIELIK